MLQGLRVAPSAPPPIVRRTVPTEMPASPATLVTPSCPDLHRWLFGGALAHPSGAIAGWREAETGRLSDEYPEISGYFLSAAVFADATSSPVVAGAAEWLTERIEANEIASRRADGPAIYNFDQGIIAAGLLKYGIRTGHARTMTAGVRAAASLRDQIQRHGHLPTLDPTGGQPQGRPATWSTVGRLHLAKTVQCLLLAAELGEGGMRDAARMLIADTRARFSLGSESFREANGETNLHSTCYALEGFWIWNAANDEDDRDELLEATMDELIAKRLPSGGFPRNASLPGEQSDVTSQVARLALLLAREEAARPTIARLRAVAIPTERGYAMPYQPEASELHQNAWVTMFAAQSLALADGVRGLEWWELI